MGLLDRAKKLAEQAKDVAEHAKGLAEGALADARARTGGADDPIGGDAEDGTEYVAGMLGRPGWSEQGLADPAAVLPIEERDGTGIPRDTRSAIVEESFGMGRRWTAGERSAGLFYQLHPDHRSWSPPTGWTPLVGVEGASAADLPDGRSLVRVEFEDRLVVLELVGLDDARLTLAHAVARQLAVA